MEGNYEFWINPEQPYDRLVVLTPDRIISVNPDYQAVVKEFRKGGFDLAGLRDLPGYREMGISNVVYVSTLTLSTKVSFFSAKAEKENLIPFTVEMRDFEDRDKLLAYFQKAHQTDFQPDQTAPSFAGAFWDVNGNFILWILGVIAILAATFYILKNSNMDHVRIRLPAPVAMVLFWIVVGGTFFSKLDTGQQILATCAFGLVALAWSSWRTLSATYEVSFRRKTTESASKDI